MPTQALVERLRPALYSSVEALHTDHYQCTTFVLSCYGQFYGQTMVETRRGQCLQIYPEILLQLLH